MATYNREKFLATAIDSVLKQTLEDWELIIIDDGSTDHSKEVVLRYSDKRIRYFYQENKERSAARNYGISQARGQYICFLDSDDYYLENHLEVLYSKIRGNEFPVAFFCTGAHIKVGEKISEHQIYSDLQQHPVRFVFYNFILINSICIHLEILKQFRFIEDQNIFEDTNLWMRILARFPFYSIPEFTNVCVQHDERSGALFFKNADIRILNNYIRNINNVFDDAAVAKHFTSTEKKIFLKKKCIMACYSAVWAGRYWAVTRALAKTVNISPVFLIEREFFKIMKEVIVKSMRSLFPKKRIMQN
jgi:glycosyltransferase involved in cell wall biosynthesis